MQINPHHDVRISLAWLALLLIAAVSGAQETDESTAPWDYRDLRFARDLRTVERNHFNSDVRALRKGQSSYDPGDDLEFILRYFPNHHLALDAMGRLSRMQGRAITTSGQRAQRRDASAFFENAIRFAQDDGVVRMLYGIHLHLLGDNQEARQHYEAAIDLEPAAAGIHYNAGLFYLKIGETSLALKHAKLAYELGYPLPGLKNKLQEAGVWKDSHLDESDIEPLRRRKSP